VSTVLIQYHFFHDCQDFLSPAECLAFQKFIDSLPLELTPPKKRGEADRVNCELAGWLAGCVRTLLKSTSADRFSIPSTKFAQELHSLLVPHLPFFPSRSDRTRKPHSFNNNIRCYKYTPAQYFGSVILFDLRT
jgi:hypothetical protein